MWIRVGYSLRNVLSPEKSRDNFPIWKVRQNAKDRAGSYIKQDIKSILIAHIVVSS